MKSKKLLLLFAVFTLSVFTHAQTIRHVKEGMGFGTKDGSSWANASGDLQLMINQSSAGDQIWVAKGTYSPNRAPNNVNTLIPGNFTSQLREASFLLKKDVKIYGGFPATGDPTMSDRNSAVHVTSLNGAKSGVYDSPQYVENVYHLVVSVGDVGTAELNGFELLNGKANGTGAVLVNGASVTRTKGAAIYNHNSSPKIVNCSFSSFQSSEPGTVIYNYQSSSKIINCYFSEAGYYTGKIMLNENSSPTILNSTFNFEINPGQTFAVILNRNNSTTKIYNSILWGRIYNPTYNHVVIDESGSVTDIRYSLVQRMAANPTKNILDGVNTSFTYLGNRGRLPNGSPAIDAGSNALYNQDGRNGMTDKDYSNELRIWYGTIDLGANEWRRAMNHTNNIIYVNLNTVIGNTASDNSGTSWENAANNLGDVLTWAKSKFPVDSLEIWVAEGTYKPTSKPTNVRTSSFEIAKNVHVYGGFKGNESVKSERDWVNNPTILSGDLDNDGVRSTGDAYHIVTSIGDTGSARLEGFTISGGNANNNGGSSGIQEYGGSGLYVSGSSLNVVNCVFTNNYGVRAGGAVYIINSSPVFRNVLFHGNTAGSYGGAAYITNSSPKFINVTISDNVSNQGAGLATSAGGPITLDNSIIYNNKKSDGTTSADLIAFTTYGLATTNIRNSYIDNRGWNWGAGFADEGGNIVTAANPFATGYELSKSSAAINAGNNQYYTDAGGNISVDKDLYGNQRLVGAAIDIGAYESACNVAIPTVVSPQHLPAGATVADLAATALSGNTLLWYDAAIGGTPLATTALIGDTTYYVSQVSSDGCESARVAVEVTVEEAIVLNPDQNGILYVKKDGVGTKDGSSWANAAAEVADALKYAKEQEIANQQNVSQIWVAAGTYKPMYDVSDDKKVYNLSNEIIGSTTDRDKAFLMVEGVKLYGGFEGINETAITQRDWNAHKTILSGDLGIENDSTDNAYHVFLSIGTVTDPISSATVLDGFTIIGGNADDASIINVNNQIQKVQRNAGGGFYNINSSPTLSNVTISANTANGGGGMFNLDNSSPTLTDVTISANTANGGGGMFNLDNSSPILTDVTFSGNVALSIGGGIANAENSSPTLTNVTLTGNIASSNGGGIFNDGSSSTLTNVIISENEASQGGGMFNVNSSSLTLINVTLLGNTASGGGGIFNVNSSPGLTDVTISENTASLGAGIYNENNSSPALTNVTLSDNVASSNGGGMFNTGSTPSLTNVTILQNTANLGAGMFNNGSSPTLTNVTLSGNTASSEGGGMFNVGASPKIYNSIVLGNNKGIFNALANDIPEYKNSLVQTGDATAGGVFITNATGNITGTEEVNSTANDIFVNHVLATVGSPTTAGDYTLKQTASAVINKGDDNFNTSTTDLAGNTRFIGSKIDLGAYEAPAFIQSAESSTNNQPSLNIEAAGSSQVGIRLNSNISYSIDISHNWLTADKPNAIDSDTITFTASFNPGNTERTATVTFTETVSSPSGVKSRMPLLKAPTAPYSFTLNVTQAPGVTTGTDYAQHSQLNVYPNPVTNGIFTVEINADVKAAIYDVKGSLIKNLDLKEGKNTIEIGDFREGIYMIRTDNGGQVKFVVK